MGSSASIPTFPVASVEVSAGSGDHGGIRRHPGYKDELRSHRFEDAKTLYENFQRGVRISRESPCLGWRPIDAEGKAGAFVWETYAETDAKVTAIAGAIETMGLAPAPDAAGGAAAGAVDEDSLRLVGLFSKNRAEWVIAEQACNRQSIAVVPLYDTLGADAVEYVLQQTQLRTVFASKEVVHVLLEVKKEKAEALPAFAAVVQFEDVTDEERAAAAAIGLELTSFAEAIVRGKGAPTPAVPPSPTDIATLCYTSGTTGNPKGAMLTHGNMIADASAALYAGVQLSADDVHLSYLPLAHVFERLIQVVGFMGGARVGFYQGDTRLITSDLAALRPTLFPSVPRLFNKIYDKIVGGVEAKGGVAAALFKKGLTAKKYWLKRNHLEYGFYDKLVFNKVKTKLGLDRCRLMVTGSAPISAAVMEFCRCVFSCRVLEGYGQTECSAACSVTAINDQASLGHVGGPLACNEIRLEAVDEMGYLPTDTKHTDGTTCEGRGEVCVRGPNVFAGYYKMASKTAETVDSEGWLHTGDIGIWDAKGNLRIVDRKKNIFKLSQGEYVAAEKVENVYAASPWIAQIFIYGDSLQSCLVAVAVPDEEYVLHWAKGNGKAGATFAELVADPAVKKEILASMKGLEGGVLKGFEKARALHLDAELWSVDNGLLTPTFKSKRPQLKTHYQSTIDALYLETGSTVAGQTGLRQGGAAAAGTA